MISEYVKETVKRGLVSLVRRRIYFIMMVVVPLLGAFFFLELIKSGSVEQAPVGLVDLDNTSLSRNLSRHLAAMQQVDVVQQYASFDEARQAVQRGEILGFFFIPANLSDNAGAGEDLRQFGGGEGGVLRHDRHSCVCMLMMLTTASSRKTTRMVRSGAIQ